MRKARILACALCALAALLLPVSALAEEAAPVLSEAQAAIVEDEAGNVLWGTNTTAELPMASITKVMTAMVALDSGINLDDTVSIVDVYLGDDSQTVGFTSSDTPTWRELLQAMLVYSGNDAAYNVAVNVAGSEEAFVGLMNEKATELGMAHTHFMNPHGLEEDGHYSCVEDLATMGRAALTGYPFIAATVRLHSVTVTVAGYPVTLASTDELLSSYAGMLGIKTGSVSAGTAFLGACERRGVRLYTAVLGCSTSWGRFADTTALLSWAYDTYSNLKVSRRDWVVDVEPYALNFYWKVIVSPSADTDLAVWPSGGAVTYADVRTRRNLVLDASLVVGTTTWTQDGRQAGLTTFVTRPMLTRAPAVGPFQLGFYANLTSLGEGAAA